MSFPQPEQDLTRLIEVLDRTFPQVPPHPSHGQQALLVEALRTRTSPQAIEAASAASMKRKREPRPKLDNEKCARCRKDKVKCSPQPRAWPAKCERCSIKGFECSPGEVKRRSKMRLLPNSPTPSGLEPTRQGDQVANARGEAQRVSVERPVENSQHLWNCTDVMNLVTSVQLMKHERSLITEVVIFFERLGLHIADMNFGSPFHGGSQLYGLWQVFKKDIRKMLCDRQNSDSLAMADRIICESAHEALSEELIPLRYELDLPRCDPISEESLAELPVGVQIRHAIRKLRLDIQRRGSCDFTLLDELVSEFVSGQAGWAAFLGLSDPSAYFIFYLTAAYGLVASQEFPTKPLIRMWVRDCILRSENDTSSFPMVKFAEIWNSDSDSISLLTLVSSDAENPRELPLLHVAILCNKPRIVRALVKDSLNTKPRLLFANLTIFHFAASVGSVDCYLALLRCEGAESVEGKGDDEMGDLPLHIAAGIGHKNMVDYILDLHSDKETYVNERNSFGQTPLMQAAGSGKYDVVQFLLDYPGVDIAAVDDDGKTALVHAIENEDVFRLILSKFTYQYFNTIGESGATPLHWLAECAGGKAMEIVLGLPSILPDEADADGRTPLCCAVDSGNFEAVKVLGIRRDVDVTKLCTGGINYIAFAKIRARQLYHQGCSQVLDWLKTHCKELEADLADWKVRGDTSKEE